MKIFNLSLKKSILLNCIEDNEIKDNKFKLLIMKMENILNKFKEVEYFIL